MPRVLSTEDALRAVHHASGFATRARVSLRPASVQRRVFFLDIQCQPSIPHHGPLHGTLRTSQPVSPRNFDVYLASYHDTGGTAIQRRRALRSSRCVFAFLEPSMTRAGRSVCCMNERARDASSCSGGVVVGGCEIRRTVLLQRLAVISIRCVVLAHLTSSQARCNTLISCAKTG